MTSIHLRHSSSQDAASPLRDGSHEALLLLRTVFTVAPILFGLDKFTNLLTDW